MPRRRRGASAVAIEASERAQSCDAHSAASPKDLIAGALAFAESSAIVANATFIAGGHHPSPMSAYCSRGGYQSVAAAAAGRSHVENRPMSGSLKSGLRNTARRK